MARKEDGEEGEWRRKRMAKEDIAHGGHRAWRTSRMEDIAHGERRRPEIVDIDPVWSRWLIGHRQGEVVHR
ncbi:uncharacterized protein AB675_1420, partial [Cyphellophora attinorum]